MTASDDPRLDRLIELLADSVMSASDDEILRIAAAHNVDVDALVRRVRRLIEETARATVPAAAPARQNDTFAVGQTVALKSAPARLGVITRITPSNRETRYTLFIDGRLETAYASQLIAAQTPSEPTLSTLDEFHARLTALQLVEPKPHEPLFAPGRTDRLYPLSVSPRAEVHPRRPAASPAR